mgnify:FL=1
MYKGKSGAAANVLLEEQWKKKCDSHNKMIDYYGNINEKIKLVHFSGVSNFIEHYDHAPFVYDNWVDK